MGGIKEVTEIKMLRFSLVVTRIGRISNRWEVSVGCLEVIMPERIMNIWVEEC